MIKIVGLGSKGIDELTVKVYKTIKETKKLILRTKECYIVKELEKEGIEFESYDENYNTASLFSELYDFIANDVINKEREYKDIVFAVPGHPFVAEKAVQNLIEKCKDQNVQYEVLASTSILDYVVENLQVDISDGLKIVDAFDIKNKIFNKRDDLLITQVYNNLIASEVKNTLAEFYDDEIIISVLHIDQNNGELIQNSIKLYELDWQENLDHTTYVYIKKDEGNKNDIYDLIQIIDILRSPNGCPWDKKQTHMSIRRDLLEECYEVIDAIESNDIYGLEEELGDILLHVIFHISIAKENNEFNFMNVIDGICKKMIFRHPHIFSDRNIESVDEVLLSWDETKKKEKGFETLTQEMEAIAKALPALIKATKIQKKAKKVGFDFETVEDAMDKVIEELNEIKDVYKSNNMSRIEEEIGDLLFSVVNVSRMLNIDSEKALENTINKFLSRFAAIEKEAQNQNKTLNNMTLKEMDEIWEHVKKF
ncbi:MAG: nucleoside triphosphate pyrophosphohydrolase [Sarcina sp.]